MATLTFIGSGDAFCAGGRGNSCYWVEDPLGHYLVDCGPTAPLALGRLKLPLAELDGLIFTHLHGDHIAGLPLLLLELCFNVRRERPLEIAGPPGSEERFLKLFEATYPKLLPDRLPFQLRYTALQAEHTVPWEGRQISAIDAIHDPEVEPLSLRVEAPETPPLAFSGDSGWQPALHELSAGAVFICECSYAEALFPGHMSVEELERERPKMRCERLLLTHFGAAARSAAAARAERCRWEVGEDGLLIHL